MDFMCVGQTLCADEEAGSFSLGGGKTPGCPAQEPRGEDPVETIASWV